MITGIIKESGDENRVAMLPGEVSALRKLGVDVIVENSAGNKAYVFDNDYLSAGAMVGERKEVIAKSDLVLSVNLPVNEPVETFREGQVLCSVVNPVET